MNTLDLIPNPLSGAHKILSKEFDDEKKMKALKKLLILECKYNLRILDTTRWKGVDDKFKREICKNLKCDVAVAFYTNADGSVFRAVFKKAKVFKTESKEEQLQNDSRLVSIINRIETLVVVAGLSEESQIQAKTRYNIRIRNLRTLLISVLKELS